jgi:hypothetical protein
MEQFNNACDNARNSVRHTHKRHTTTRANSTRDTHKRCVTKRTNSTHGRHERRATTRAKLHAKQTRCAWHESHDNEDVTGLRATGRRRGRWAHLPMAHDEQGRP